MQHGEEDVRRQGRVSADDVAENRNQQVIQQDVHQAAEDRHVHDVFRLLVVGLDTDESRVEEHEEDADRDRRDAEDGLIVVVREEELHQLRRDQHDREDGPGDEEQDQDRRGADDAVVLFLQLMETPGRKRLVQGGLQDGYGGGQRVGDTVERSLAVANHLPDHHAVGLAQDQVGQGMEDERGLVGNHVAPLGPDFLPGGPGVAPQHRGEVEEGEDSDGRGEGRVELHGCRAPDEQDREERDDDVQQGVEDGDADDRLVVVEGAFAGVPAGVGGLEEEIDEEQGEGQRGHAGEGDDRAVEEQDEEEGAYG